MLTVKLVIFRCISKIHKAKGVKVKLCVLIIIRSTSIKARLGLHVVHGLVLGQLVKAQFRPGLGLGLYFRSWAGRGLNVP